MKYAARRLLHGLFLLAGVSLLSFLFADLAPGDFYSDLRLDPRVSPGAIQGMREQSGANRSLPARYAAWAGGILRGNFGYSLTYRTPVAPLLRERIPATLLLTGTATFAAWLLAVPFGIWIATWRDTWRDGAARIALAALLAIPDLLLAIALLVLAVETGWFPTGGMTSPGSSGSVLNLAKHLALPVAVLVAGMLPILVRHVRATMLEAIDAPFAVSARAGGIPRLRLLFRHLLPAALNPLVSLFGVSLGTLLSASLLIEVVMGWPGLGPLFLDAILARDFALCSPWSCFRPLS